MTTATKNFCILFVLSLSFLSVLAATCNEDNVYRGILHRIDQHWCSSLLANSAQLATPSYLATVPAQRAVSACSCVLARTVTDHTSSFTTLSTASPSSVTSTDGHGTSLPATTESNYPKPTLPATSPTSGVSSLPMTISTSSASTLPSPSSIPSTFTSLTPRIYANKSPCYALPTPTSNLQALPIPTTNTSNTLQYFYYSPWESVVKYLQILGGDGEIYIVDMSNSSALSVLGPNGSSMSIDASGLRFASPGCEFQLELAIESFVDQIHALSQVVNQTDPVDNWLLKPRGEVPCENAVVDIIRGGVLGALPAQQPISWATVLRVIIPVMNRLLGAGVFEVALGVAGLFLAPEVGAVMFTVQNVAGIIGVVNEFYGEDVANLICCKFHGGCH